MAGPWFGGGVDLDGSTALVGTPFGLNTSGESVGAAYILDVPVCVCAWDCGDDDGLVTVVDLLALLAQWGAPGSCDIDGGVIGVTDLLQMLANWGPCE